MEVLQAEAEQMALTLSSTSLWTSPTTSLEVKKKEAVKAAALTSGHGCRCLRNFQASMKVLGYFGGLQARC